ncbi:MULTISPECIES: hypothetical protein [unclassified Desulfosporosinus]|uniref:hypothetical protein n=1 Tax=unclassified Desulfosporosinus TaxID=2633794 RepID=UPI000223A12D|nr:MULTISPECIES: hypothetical protein [unclassified Desulfosporosinus]EGW39998.1 hypothetical protein DOT_2082 [Desulfosporosinus sp. OT]ODA41588.1 hypothetical protein DSBG_1698 [Desulfosporosinus sp. BG]
MKILKVCHACDRIIGEIELDDLTSHNVDPIMDIVGNVAYALCPLCLQEMEMEPRNVYH